MIGRSTSSKSRGAVLRILGCGAYLALLAGCSQLTVTQATTYQDNIFRITATTGYTGALVTDSGTTTVSGSSSQDIKVTATSGQQYTLTLWKTASDGTALELQLLADETVNGTATTVVVESQTTTDPNVPVRVVLLP